MTEARPIASIDSTMQAAAAILSSGPHPDRARQDAEALFLHVLGKNKAWLLAHSEDELPKDQAARFLQLIERRRTGEPIQYITGQTEFYGLPFRVTPAVLIPRPETEHLVEKAIQLAAASEGFVTGHDFSRAENSSNPDWAPATAPRILDIGTGSGAIAIALAHHLPQAQITAVDISPAALAIARENAARNSVTVRFLESDLLAALPNVQFDIIASNPPYVPTADRPTLSVEVRDHEPSLALFAGQDGLEVYRRLIPPAFSALVPGGYLLLEIGYNQSSAISAILTDAGFTAVNFVPDLQSIPRVAVGRRP